MTERVSLALARRIALAAQGFGSPRPEAVTPRDLGRTVARLGLHQIDSVNVLVRAHYLPAFSRLGAYDRGLLDRSAWGPRRDRRLFEYWGHEASLLPLELHPLLRWRMDAAARGERVYRGIRDFASERRERGEIATRGPLSASEIEGLTRGAGGWWGWSEAKIALEFLFWCGEITTAT